MIKVVLCTYNGEKFLKEQLYSIINQTSTVDKIEIFDDCSSDNTLKIVEEVIEVNKNSRVNIIVSSNKKNKGYIANFTHAIKNCTANDKVVFLCDQDDVWEPNKVEIMMQKLGDYENIPTLAYSDAVLIDDVGDFFEGTLWESIKYNTLKDVNDELTQRNIVTGATAAINYALIEIFKGTQTSTFLPHDYCLAVLASSYGSIIPITDKLTRYRLHANNQIGTSVSFLSRLKRALFNRKSATLQSEMGKFLELMEITKDQDEQKFSAFRKKWELYYLLAEHNVIYAPFILLKNKTPFKASIKLIQMSIMKYFC